MIHFKSIVKPKLHCIRGFSNVFFLFPSPPQKRVKERVAGVARSRHTGNTLFMNLGWGLAAKQSDVCEALSLHPETHANT
jgi:hypothetical protein